MRWKKLGIVWGPKGDKWWARSHAMVPTPFIMSDQVIRVFITALDDHGIGRPGYVDVDSHDPTRVIKVCAEPLIDIGKPGCFDDNGILCTCVIANDQDTLFMYYVGFEILTKIRYRLLTGLAVSSDSGETFHRLNQAPILDRSDGELYFRCGPFVIRNKTVYRMWYVAGSEWVTINGKLLPVYDLRYLESPDGIHWPSTGKIVLPITGADEHGFGRPWVVNRGGPDYQLFYSIRRRSVQAYRLGYAVSKDGLNFTRLDNQMGLDVSFEGFDSEAIMYSAVITVHGKTYCFYNGNDFGAYGFAVAVLEEEQ